MLAISKVVLFGHRLVDRAIAVEKALEDVLVDLINQNEFVDFYVGRNGDFDRIATSTIHRVIREYVFQNCTLNLVLPYKTKEFENNQASFSKYYSTIEIMFDERVYPKSAISKRNKIMVDDADLVVCYITHKSGGAWKAVKYANSNQIPVVNILDDLD